jgi:hypothetical protein
MEHQILLDNKWATICYHPVDRYIYHTFKQPIGGEPFRHILDTGLEHLREQKATKWLSDDRENAAFAPEDIEFAVTDWGPRAAQAGWKFWALIVPETFAGQASMTSIVEAFYNLGVRVMVFTEVEEGCRWLVKQ